MSKTQWRREEDTVAEKATEGFIILKAHVGFLQWEAIDREPAAVAAHHVDLISFEDVFCDLHAVQSWRFTQMNGRMQMLLEAYTIGTHYKKKIQKEEKKKEASILPVKVSCLSFHCSKQRTP